MGPYTRGKDNNWYKKRWQGYPDNSMVHGWIYNNPYNHPRHETIPWKPWWKYKEQLDSWNLRWWRNVRDPVSPWQVVHDYVWRYVKGKKARFNRRKELIKAASGEYGTGNKLLDNPDWVRELSSYM